MPSAGSDRAWGETARAGLTQALAAGERELERGGSALDAVTEAVALLEDCEAFNAGRGSVLHAEGGVEMDAALMEGAARRAGGVACVTRLANPVRAARAVLEDGAHVLLAGEGAERFALARGLEAIDPQRLVIPSRRAQLERLRAREAGSAGTGGAVARDARGGLAAATSTGGLTGKRPGRVSDSCVIGAGTWADENCAISATGVGELFLRGAFAHEVAARVRHAALDLATACARALAALDPGGNGAGGCIAIDAAGRVAWPFDTPAMPRGVREVGAAPRVAVHPEDALDPP